MNKNIQKKFASFLKKELNKQQCTGVIQKNGALLVVAGAGSGKTRVITARIANLIINESVEPKSILALTFTNKAAGEMKERITKFVGKGFPLPFIGTFHSYCLLLLRNNPTLLPNPNFSIIDADDQLSLIKKIVKANAIEKYATPTQIKFQISNFKNKIEVDDNKKDDSDVHPILKEIYLMYETEKSAARCLDFDDLILNVLNLFKKNADFKMAFQEHIKHVLVDEYQDTSHVQHSLLKEMTLCKKKTFVLNSLCAVGDEDQSIYSWRGATVANMLKFKNDFKPVTTVKIEQNYRSVKPILDAANSLISCNKLRNPKTLWSDRIAKNRILKVECRSGSQEAEAITHILNALPKGNKLSEAAILYRTHFQSRAIEEALIYSGIPYKIIGGIRFYERKEIKDLIAYLRLITNPFDKISLLRIINTPSRGLGQKFENQLLLEWAKNPLLTFSQILNHLCTDSEISLSSKKINTLKGFLEIYNVLDSNCLPTVAINAILEKTDYLSYLQDSYDNREAETKQENVQEFVQSIKLYEQTFDSQKIDSKLAEIPPNDPFYSESNTPTLESFLYEVALMQEKTDADNKKDQVQMMTLHAAKGLEFDTVVIAGLEEGLLPSSRSLDTTEKLEEERRLFYVGITRAKERLIFLHASYRSTYGQIADQVFSRFGDEIKKNLISTINIENMNNLQQELAIGGWMNNKKQKNSLLTFSSQEKTEKAIEQQEKNSFVFHESSSRRHTKKINSFSGARSSALWNKNDQVAHKTFGSGIITNVKNAGGDNFYLTIIFKSGQKKILSGFVKKIE
jgi:DNA helicase II / ATP-dependent DNA helicase PcrA